MDLPAIQGHVEVVRSIAATLDPAQGDCASREVRFTVLGEQLQASADSVRRRMAKVLTSFHPGLFAGGDAADLPQDNLELERWFRNPKGHERRIHGHRHAGVRIVLEGPTLIHALDVHQRRSDPLTVADLLPLSPRHCSRQPRSGPRPTPPDAPRSLAPQTPPVARRP